MLLVHLTRVAFIATAFFPAAACQSAVTEAPQARSTLIAVCKAEAVRGHLQGLMDERRKHHERMTTICEVWRSVDADQRDDLSKRCLAESGRGPTIGHRQRPTNQSHIFRLRELCRKLSNT